MKTKVVRRYPNGKVAAVRKELTPDDIQGRFFTFDVNYGGEDVFPYYFKADNAMEVANATGVDIDYIFEMSKAEVCELMKKRKHIDRVVNGRLVERAVC